LFDKRQIEIELYEAAAVFFLAAFFFGAAFFLAAFFFGAAAFLVTFFLATFFFGAAALVAAFFVAFFLAMFFLREKVLSASHCDFSRVCTLEATGHGPLTLLVIEPARVNIRVNNRAISTGKNWA
jgi:hypothetical protein